MAYSLQAQAMTPQDNTPLADAAVAGSEHNVATIYYAIVDENLWTFYKYDFTRLAKKESMLDGFVVIATGVSTDQQLVSLLQQNKIDHTPANPGRCNYCFYRKSIPPIWEDPFNRQGGRFIISFSIPTQVTPDKLHGYWALLTRIVLQKFRYSPYITGVKVHWWLPKDHFMSVWTSRIFYTQEYREMYQILIKIVPDCNVRITYGTHTALLEKINRYKQPKSYTTLVPVRTAANPLCSSIIAANALGASSIAANPVGPASIAANPVGPASISADPLDPSCTSANPASGPTEP